jgi:hypothetical protein
VVIYDCWFILRTWPGNNELLITIHELIGAKRLTSSEYTCQNLFMFLGDHSQILQVIRSSSSLLTVTPFLDKGIN